MKERVTIAIDEALLHIIDCMAEKQGRSRSNFVEMSMRQVCKEINSHGDSSRADNTGD